MQTSSGEQKAIPTAEKKTQPDAGGNSTNGGGEKSNRDNNKSQKVLLTLLECVDAVHQLTGLNWEEIYRIAAVDFLAYVNFWNYKVRKEQKQIDEFKRKNKIK